MDFTTTMLLMTLFIVAITGGIMALTPYLMKKSECFAVNVPESASNDPYLKKLKRTYATIVLILTAIFLIIGIVICFLQSGNSVVFLVMMATLVLSIGGYALMLAFRQKVLAFKQSQYWVAEAQEAVAMVGGEEIPRPISLKWNLAQIPIILITLAIGIVGYSIMPDEVVFQINAQGEPSNIVDKSPFVVLFPVLLQGFLALTLLFSQWTIMYSKKEANPLAPVSSALAYGMFSRAQSIAMFLTGILLNITFISIPLSFMGIISIGQAGFLVMIVAVIVVIAVIGISIIYGQGGSRLFLRMAASNNMVVDNDVYWKLGIFYWNPEDPSLFLPKRFGIGWTVNWARPALWLIIAAFIVITVGFIAILGIYA